LYTTFAFDKSNLKCDFKLNNHIYNSFIISPKKARVRVGGGMMLTTRERLGARIKELRKTRHLTQEQLAERVDLATRYISLIEVGRSSPSLETMDSIATALGVEIKDLFEFAHLQAGGVKVEGIEQLMVGVDEEKKRTIMKIVRAVVR
jgi:transcriptional regulator with XRE-family HTH domain